MAEEKICGIYCITNLVNGKVYIGQSVNIEKRWVHHKTTLRHNMHINKHLQSAWNKYGEQNFEFIILHECIYEDLDRYEIYYIEKYNSIENGYNLLRGGSNGNRFTQIVIDKMKSSQAKRYSDVKAHQKLSSSIQKFMDSENGDLWKEKQSKKRKEYYLNEENRLKHSEILKEALSLEENKLKISMAQKKRFSSENGKQEKITQMILKGKAIVRLNLDMSISKKYFSSYDVDRDGFPKTSVLKRCNHQTKNNIYRDYIWMYEKEYNEFLESQNDNQFPLCSNL